VRFDLNDYSIPHTHVLVDHIVNHGARLKHPHVPVVPYLAQDFDKDSPTGFIGMPIGLGAQL
jgi:hypothetical protein